MRGRREVTVAVFLSSLSIAASLLLVNTTGFAQTAPDTLWTRTHGGALFDAATSIQQTDDGGYIVAGSTESFGNGGADAWLVKLDEDGDQIWDQTFGGTGDDHASFVQQTADGGYIVVGINKSLGNGREDIWLIKTDENGVETWNKLFGGPDDDRAHSVRVTSDGGYVLAGKTGNYETSGEDVWLIKTDEDGVEVWNRTCGGADNEKAYLVQETTDGGYIMAGYTESYGNGQTDAWLVKADEDGYLVWDKTFGGPDFENAYFVQQTADGGYILAGYTRSYGAGEGDVWLIKTDENGDESWNKMYGGNQHDVAYAVQETVEGNFILAGLTNSRGAGGFDVWLIKTDGDGNETWNGTYGGSSDEYSFSVQQTADGGYVAAGYTSSFGSGGDDCYVVRVSSDETPTPTAVSSFASRWSGGHVEIEWRLSDPEARASFEVYRREAPGGSYVGVDAGGIRASDGRFLFRDKTAQAGKTYTYRVVVIEDGNTVASFETAVDTQALSLRLDQNLPNPFNPATRIRFALEREERATLSIYDAEGKLVATLIDRRVGTGEHVAEWDGRDGWGDAVASGVYIYRLTAGKRSLARKAVLLR